MIKPNMEHRALAWEIQDLWTMQGNNAYHRRANLYFECKVAEKLQITINGTNLNYQHHQSHQMFSKCHRLFN